MALTKRKKRRVRRRKKARGSEKSGSARSRTAVNAKGTLCPAPQQICLRLTCARSWAFVDFLSTSQATSSLTNPRNHTLDGRKLVVEYASPDAVRRGGHSEGFAAAAAANGAARGGGKGKGRVGKKERLAKKADVDPSALEAEPVEAFATTALEMANEAAEGAVRPLKKKEAFKGRQKPGAALANAKRGRTGIVKGGEGMGKKVVFS